MISRSFARVSVLDYASSKKARIGLLQAELYLCIAKEMCQTPALPCLFGSIEWNDELVSTKSLPRISVKGSNPLLLH